MTVCARGALHARHRSSMACPARYVLPSVAVIPPPASIMLGGEAGPASARGLHLATHLAARELRGVDVRIDRPRAHPGQEVLEADADDVGGLEAAFIEQAVAGGERVGREVRARPGE